MSMSDPIADLLTRIRNAVERRYAFVVVPASALKLAVVRVMEEEGYIDGFTVLDEPVGRPMIRVRLRYDENRTPAICHLERVSRPGRRVYAKTHDIPRVLSGMGVAILTTPKGVMTGKQARRENVGGEVLCYVW
jgi:small subunit ribosomal protein S8